MVAHGRTSVHRVRVWAQDSHDAHGPLTRLATLAPSLLLYLLERRDVLRPGQSRQLDGDTVTRTEAEELLGALQYAADKYLIARREWPATVEADREVEELRIKARDARERVIAAMTSNA